MERRGRSALPTIRARTRRRRRRRRWRLVRTVISRPLSDLARDELVAVADSLALVGLRRAALADVRGNLPDQLLVDPPHDDLGRLRDLELDPLGGLDRDRMRVAERQLEALAFE